MKKFNHSFCLYFLIFFNSLVFNCFTYQITPKKELSPFWKNYFNQVDTAISENFWGNLTIYKKTRFYHDPYIEQMLNMGYCFDDGNESPAPFYQSLQWIIDQITTHLDNRLLTTEDVLWPGKAFQINDETGNSSYIFLRIGQDVPAEAEPLNLLTPDVFVKMLSEGYFPLGNAIREHTNQTLAEHDLAHMAGFVSSPHYMKVIREAFRRVGKKMKENPRVRIALQDFDSAYSLRLYYMIEIFTEIPGCHYVELQDLIEIPLDQPPCKELIVSFLHQKAKDPATLHRYLHHLYWNLHRLMNPLGGESRDILNRRRKFKRNDTLGSFYDSVSTQASKFFGNSIYSLLLNAMAALENKRSNHNDYLRSLVEIHTPLIGALIGTSQLSLEDWILECVEETPNPTSKLYRYIHDSGLWDEHHLLYRAYCNPNYDEVLK